MRALFAKTLSVPLSVLGVIVAAGDLSAQSAVSTPTNPPVVLSEQNGLSLEEAMNAAEQHSFTAKIAHASVEEAEQRAGQTRAQLGPKLALEGTNAWVDKSTNELVGQTLPNGTYVPARVQSAALVATQPIVGFGALLYKLRADAMQAEALRQDEQTSQADARLLGADAYLRALKGARFFSIAQASLAVIEKQKNDALALKAQGKLSPVDVMRLDLALSEATTQLIQARSTLDVTALSLREALGLAAEDKSITLRASQRSSWEERKLGLPDLSSSLSIAKQQRPDLKSADLKVQAAEKYKTAANFDYLPMINGFARYERDFVAPDIDIPALTPGGSAIHYDREDVQNKLSYGLSLNWTIWEWGLRARRSGELAATVQKAHLAQDALSSRADIEVAQAHAELSYAQQALEQSRASLRFAEEVYRATELKFRNGIATTTDLITAERDQTRARSGLANAQGDIDLAWLKLKKTSGERVAL